MEGLNPRSLQGDRGIVEIIGRLGGDKNEVIDASEIPDLVPIVAVLAALRDGAETAIVRAGRLRLKESDRLSAIRTELSKLGADIEETAEDSLFIRGKKELEGGICDAWGDHRIAMALAIAATAARDEIIIAGAESVSKSYPRFWEDYASLGGILG